MVDLILCQLLLLHQPGAIACRFGSYRNSVHASEGCHHSSSSQNQHSTHNNVGQEAEEEKDQMGCVSPAGMHNLQDCMC